MSTDLQRVGVESDLIALLTNKAGGSVARVKFRLKDPEPPGALPVGDSLDVVLCARVYEDVDQAGLPAVPHAQGPEVHRTARVNEWSVVDLELPPVPSREGGYLVQAKVYSHDKEYRRNFDPSECFVRRLAYGFPSP
jgi:hypothetical protein